MFTVLTVACCCAAAIALSPIAAADPDQPSGPNHGLHTPAQGAMELPTDRGRHHVLRQDQNVGGQIPGFRTELTPTYPIMRTISAAPIRTPLGTDPDVPYGTWAQN